MADFQSTVPATALPAIEALERGEFPDAMTFVAAQSFSDDVTIGGDLAVTGTTALTGNATISEPILGPGGVKLKWWRSSLIGSGTSAEVDTTFDLPARGQVHDVLVRVVTAETTGTTKTLDVGLLSSESGGDADGFLDGISVAATGMKRGTFVATVGSNNTYLGAAGTHTIGALSTQLLIAGEDTAAGGDGVGIKAPFLTDSVTAKSVSYSRGSTLTELQAYIFILYSEIP